MNQRAEMSMHNMRVEKSLTNSVMQVMGGEQGQLSHTQENKTDMNLMQWEIQPLLDFKHEFDQTSILMI